MTRDEARRLLPIIHAYVDGFTVEYKRRDGTWSSNDGHDFPANREYRIKPKPRVFFAIVPIDKTNPVVCFDSHSDALRYQSDSFLPEVLKDAPIVKLVESLNGNT